MDIRTILNISVLACFIPKYNSLIDPDGAAYAVVIAVASEARHAVVLRRRCRRSLLDNIHRYGVREQVSAEREGRAVLGPAVCDVVPVRRLRLPSPLHADHIHRLQEVM